MISITPKLYHQPCEIRFPHGYPSDSFLLYTQIAIYASYLRSVLHSFLDNLPLILLDDPLLSIQIARIGVLAARGLQARRGGILAQNYTDSGARLRTALLLLCKPPFSNKTAHKCSELIPKLIIDSRAYSEFKPQATSAQHDVGLSGLPSKTGSSTHSRHLMVDSRITSPYTERYPIRSLSLLSLFT